VRSTRESPDFLFLLLKKEKRGFYFGSFSKRTFKGAVLSTRQIHTRFINKYVNNIM